MVIAAFPAVRRLFPAIATMFSVPPLFFFYGTSCLLLLMPTCHSAALQQRSSNLTTSSPPIAHSHYVTEGPLPILELGLDDILGQLGSNATAAGNSTLSKSLRQNIALGMSTSTKINELDAPAQCGQDQPCADGSCCNSEGKCGYTSYTCGNTAGVTCLSNCNVKAMCGMNSLDGNQHCPLNLCCSYFGFCGTSNLYCTNTEAIQTANPCQQGYGSCQVIPSPSCPASAAGSGSASRGRKVGYYQANGVYRICNRMGPKDIDVTGFTHMIFAFASIDPHSFHVIPVDSNHPAMYAQFTARGSEKLGTWIGLGGFSFSDPGPTHTTWSNMVSSSGNRASFISSLINFMEQYGFTGVDLDWEFPGLASRGGIPSDTANFVCLVQEMRSAFGRKYGISIALPPDYATLQYFDPIAMAPSIDFFNFMSYDLHGTWEASILGANVRSQSSIIDISSDILPLWFDKVPPSKVNFGMAYYGRGFTLQDPGCTDIGCPYTGPSNGGPCTDSPGVLSLREIEVIIQQRGLTPKLLNDEMVKQITWDNQWIGYDDADTVNLKANWADLHCLGGLVFWSMDLAGAGTGEAIISTSNDLTCSSTGSCPSSAGCCSAYGFCGSDRDFCSVNNGCQVTLGTCNTISIDGSCGPGKTCLGSAMGNCCSKNGWCGTGDGYCGAGCQGLFGSCS